MINVHTFIVATLHLHVLVVPKNDLQSHNVKLKLDILSEIKM